MDWYSKTFVLPLLYPTPARHCTFVLIFTSQLSASSRELKTSEPSLCYVFPECPTSWCPGPMQNGQVVPYKPDFSDVLPQLVLTTLPHWPPIAVDNLAAKLKASKNYLRAECQLRDGSSTAVGRRIRRWFHNSKARGQCYMPEKQGMGHPQKQASPMDKVRCGLLILSTHVVVV